MRTWTLVPLLCGISFAQTHVHETRVVARDFDLALRKAELVVAAAVAPDGSRDIRVVEVLAGVRPTGPIRLADMSRFGTHFEPPADGKVRLLFLHRMHRGWYVTQRAGLMRPWSQATALRPLIRALQALRAPRVDRASLTAHVSLAAQLRAGHPELSASLLRALARRPELAPRLESTSRDVLRVLLTDASEENCVRDHAARCLAATGDANVAMELVGMMSSGRAKGLGGVFGRLLEHLRPGRCIGMLQGAFARSAAHGHVEILRAAWQTGRPEARRWVRSFGRHPQLAAAVVAITS